MATTTNATVARQKQSAQPRNPHVNPRTRDTRTTVTVKQPGALQNARSNPVAQQRKQRSRAKQIGQRATRRLRPRWMRRRRKKINDPALRTAATTWRVFQKTKLIGLAASQSIFLAVPYAATAVLAALSIYANYFIDDSMIGSVTSFFLPLEQLDRYAGLIIAALGVVFVTTSYALMLATFTNIFSGRVAIPFLMASVFYMACLVYPPLGIAPVMIIWLWVVAIIY